MKSNIHYSELYEAVTTASYVAKYRIFATDSEYNNCLDIDEESTYVVMTLEQLETIKKTQAIVVTKRIPIDESKSKQIQMENEHTVINSMIQNDMHSDLGIEHSPVIAEITSLASRLWLNSTVGTNSSVSKDDRLVNVMISYSDLVAELGIDQINNPLDAEALKGKLVEMTEQLAVQYFSKLIDQVK